MDFSQGEPNHPREHHTLVPNLSLSIEEKKREKKRFDMSFTVCDLKKRITHYMFYPEIVVF